ncbi:MAG: T9SS type A sorting domain-containing protein [Saprospiraceae bacterium]|nr:T9SS type A sorting domain-containing protein [Saprospiraceae bacterium]
MAFGQGLNTDTLYLNIGNPNVSGVLTFTNEELKNDFNLSEDAAINIYNCNKEENGVTIQTLSDQTDISSTSIGTYPICLTYSENGVLKTHTWQLVVYSSIVPIHCDPPASCNSVCFSDFSAFDNFPLSFNTQLPINQLTYSGELNQQNNYNVTARVIYIQSGTSDNECLELNKGTWDDFDGIRHTRSFAIIPLNKPIKIGADFKIKYLGYAQRALFANNKYLMVHWYGLNDINCQDNRIEFGGCGQDLDLFCSGKKTTKLDENPAVCGTEISNFFAQTQNEQLPNYIRMQPYELNFTNNFGFDLNYLVVTVGGDNMPIDTVSKGAIYLDDVEVYSQYPVDINVTEDVTKTCNKITVEYNICGISPNHGTTDIDVNLNVNINNSQPNQTINIEGDFDANGKYTGHLIDNGDCLKVTLVLSGQNISADLISNIQLQINLLDDCNSTNSLQFSENWITTTGPLNPDFVNTNCTLGNLFTPVTTSDSHTWSVNNGLLTSNQVSPSFAFPNPGVYNVVHTVTDICGNSFSSIKEIIATDCISTSCNCPSSSLNTYVACNLVEGANSHSIFSSFGLSSEFISVSNLCFHVFGTLKINQDIDLKSCHFVMHPGSKILIEDAVRVSFLYCEFIGCEKMWKGIYIDQSKAKVAFQKRNYIQDAEYGIKILESDSDLKSGLLTINNIVFNNNYIGVSLEFEKPTKGIFATTMLHNIFKSTRKLLAPYPGQPNYDTIAFAGIKLNNNTHFNLYPALSFNFIFGTQNEFDSIQNGILAKKTNMMVGNAIFTKMLGTSYNHNNRPPKGKGIFCDSCYFVDVKDITVNSADVGVMFERSSFAVVNIIGSQITATTGVRLISSTDASYTIDSNRINSKPNCIYGLNSIGNGQLFVRHNELTSSNPTFLDGLNLNGGCIHFNQDPLVVKGAINQNQISPGTNVGGIVLNGVNGSKFSVQSNSIDGNQNLMGIGLYGTSGIRLYENTINTNTPFDEDRPSMGIFLESSPNNLFCCNYINGYQRSIWSNFVNMDTKLRTSHISNAQYGLWLEQGSYISPQKWTNNRWSQGTFSGLGAYNQNSNSNSVNMSKFTVQTNTWPLMPSNGNAAGVDAWFEKDLNTINNCYSDVVCNLSQPPKFGEEGNEYTYSDQIQLSGDYGNIPHKNGYIYFGKKYMLGKIKDATVETLNKSEVISFKNATKDGPLDQIVNIETALTNNHPEEDPAYQNIRQKIDTITSIRANLKVHYNILENKYFAILDSLTVVNAIEGLGERLDLEYQGFSILINGFTNTRMSTLNAFAAELSSIVPSSQELIQDKQFNNLVIEGMKKQFNNWTPAQFDQLIAIGNLCPLDYGNAVYWARNMALIQNQNLVFDDHCQTIEENLEKRDITQNMGSELKIFPNPSNGIYNIGGLEVGSTLSIYNALGQMIKMQHIISTSERLDISQSPHGLYLLKISGNSTDKTYRLLVQD